MPCETLFGPASGLFDFTVFNAVVHEHDTPPGGLPRNIIRTDQDWSVHVNWTVDGMLTGMIAGFWDLHVALESIGPGPELDLTDPGDHVIPLVTGGGGGPVNYTREVNIAAGVVPALPHHGSELYIVGVSMTYREVLPGGLIGPPGPLACHSVERTVQFYNPGPPP